MASLSTRPSSDHLSQCYALVRWLRSNGISWSGTASELSSQLAQDADAKHWFVDVDDIVAFLEANSEALCGLGLELSVRKLPGRPRLIDLQIDAEQIQPKPVGPVEVVRQPPEINAPSVIEERGASTSETVEDAYVPLFGRKSEPLLEPIAPPRGSASRLFTLLGVAADEGVVNPSYREDVAKQTPPARYGMFAQKVKYEEERERLWPLVIACVVLFVVIVTFMLVVRKNAATANAVIVTNPAAAAEPAAAPPTIDPEEAQKTKDLLQQASTTRTPSQQYDLAMRYESGLGVERDRATAYAWLTLARANGSTRAPSMIRNLGEQLSPTEMQRARIMVGRAFASGLSVPRSYVVAHNWLSLADLAGSAEARTLKKQLESKMSPEQIQRANSQSGSR